MCTHRHMSDDSLLAHFDRMPVSELIHIDQVCPRWASLLPQACARRRTLVLVLGALKMEDIDYFKLPFNDKLSIVFTGATKYCNSNSKPHFSLSAVECQAAITSIHLVAVTKVVKLFTNLHTFVVIHTRCSETELNLLIGLLRPWSLRTLKLWLQESNFDDRYESQPDQNPVHSLLSSISQQASLQQLTLDIGLFGWCKGIPAESFSFIGRIQVVKLYLNGSNSANLLWDIVHRFNSERLQSITFGNGGPCQLAASLNPQFEFTTKVRQLYFAKWEFATVGQFDQFCSRYPSLTMLQLNWTPNITFTRLLTNLATLSQLSQLKLNIDFNLHPENAFALLDQAELGCEEEARPISLMRVKILELQIQKRSHHEFESLSRQVFPLVQVIILDDHTFIDECPTCRLEKFPHYSERDCKCHRLLVLSLKDKFAHSLEKIFVTRHYHDHSMQDWSNSVPCEYNWTTTLHCNAYDESPIES